MITGQGMKLQVLLENISCSCKTEVLTGKPFMWLCANDILDWIGGTLM